MVRLSSEALYTRACLKWGQLRSTLERLNACLYVRMYIRMYVCPYVRMYAQRLTSKKSISKNSPLSESDGGESGLYFFCC